MLVQKKIWFEKKLGPEEKLYPDKNLGSDKKMDFKKNLGSEKNVGPKTMLVSKFLFQHFSANLNQSSKNSESWDLGSQTLFSKSLDIFGYNHKSEDLDK